MFQGETLAVFENPLLQERILQLTSLREELKSQLVLRSELAVLNTEEDYNYPPAEEFGYCREATCECSRGNLAVKDYCTFRWFSVSCESKLSNR